MPALRSQQLGFNAPVVSMVDPQGNLVPIQTAQALTALSQGFRLQSDEERLEESHGDKNLAAGVLGAMRGATMGLSDKVLTDFGVMNPNEIRDIEAANPNISMAGEFAGILGGGAVGAAGKAVGAGKAALGVDILRGVTAPSRLVTQIGYTVEGELLRYLTSGSKAATLAAKGADVAATPFAKRALAKTIAYTGAGAVEGGLYGVGQAISEDALGDPKHVGQSLVAHIGFGALTGGVAGGIFGGGHVLGQSALGFTKKAKDTLGKTLGSSLSKEEARFYGGGVLKDLGIKPPKKIRSRPKALEEWKHRQASVLTEEGLYRDGSPIATIDMPTPQIVSRLRETAEDASHDIGRALRMADDIVGQPVPFEDKLRKILQPKGWLDEAVERYRGTPDYHPMKAKAQELRSWMDDSVVAPASFQEMHQLRNKVKWASPLEKDLRAHMQELITADMKTLAPEAAEGYLKANELVSKLRDLAESSSMPKVAGIGSDTFIEQFAQHGLRSVAWRLTYGAGILGGISGGLTGAAIGVGAAAVAPRAKMALLKKWPQLSTKIGKLRATQKMLEEFDLRIAKAVAKLSQGTPKLPTRLAATSILTRLTGKRDQKKAAKEVAMKFHRLVGNPEKLADQLSLSFQGMDEDMPNVAREAMSTAIRALELAQQAMPVPPVDLIMQPKSDDWDLSEQQIHNVSRVLGALEDPASVIEEAAYGVGDPLASSVVRAVYGDLMALLGPSILEVVAKDRRKLSNNARMQLGHLFGLELDELALPHSLMQAQLAHQAAAPPPEQKGTPARMKDDLGTPYETQGQRNNHVSYS